MRSFCSNNTQFETTRERTGRWFAYYYIYLTKGMEKSEKMDFQSKSLQKFCRQTLSTTTTKEEEEEEEEEEEWISSRTRCNKKSGKASTP